MAPATKRLPTGKRPATYDSRDILYADIRRSTTLPKIPGPEGGYGNDFKAGVWPGWGMYGNGPCDDGSITDQSWAAYQGAGNCVWAGGGHETMESDKNAQRTVARFTCLNLLQQYSAYAGYNLQTGANDNGSDVREVLKWRQTKGLVDANGNAHKIGVYVSLEPTNLTDLWEALWLFEAVGIGINFPTSAMDQFNNNNQIWSVVQGAQVDGGHYIPLVGHPTVDIWTCITWGMRQTMTPQFIQKYCDEAYAYITPERYNAVTGETLEHYKDADLEKYISLVGQTTAA